MKVLIDPGHGGMDPGATYNNLYEKDLTLEIGLLLAHKLQLFTSHVALLTRHVDKYVSLQDRVAIEKKINPDVFISLHCNSATNPKANGIEIFTYFGVSKADRLAEILYEELRRIFPDRRYRTDTTDGDQDKEAGFYVLKHTKAPAVLIEMEFISNRKGRAFLSNKFTQSKLVDAIIISLKRWREENDKV